MVFEVTLHLAVVVVTYVEGAEGDSALEILIGSNLAVIDLAIVNKEPDAPVVPLNRQPMPFRQILGVRQNTICE